MCKLTVEIHWEYGNAIFPSGMSAGPAYCSPTCPFMEKNDAGKSVCDLFVGELTPVNVDGIELHVPTYECTRQELQGR
jgi:hypothetical protein